MRPSGEVVEIGTSLFCFVAVVSVVGESSAKEKLVVHNSYDTVHNEDAPESCSYTYDIAGQEEASL